MSVNSRDSSHLFAVAGGLFGAAMSNIPDKRHVPQAATNIKWRIPEIMFRTTVNIKCRGRVIIRVVISYICRTQNGGRSIFLRASTSYKRMIFIHPAVGLDSEYSAEGDQFLPRDRSKPNPAESTGERPSMGQLAQKGDIASGSVRRGSFRKN